MSEMLRILLLEDTAADAELNERMLQKAGVLFTSLRVDNREDYLAALENFKPDLILADYQLPGFNGLQALNLMKERSHFMSIPFIVVTGAIGEELAVDTIKEGATDYVLKDRLARLPTAVLRALEEKKYQKDRYETQAKLVHSETSLREAQHIALLGSWELDLLSNGLSWSDEIYCIFEINQDQFGATYDAFLNAIHPEDREYVNKAYTESVENHLPYDIVHRLLMPDGRIKYVREICKTSYDPGGKPLCSTGTIQDITLQHEAEESIHHLNRTLRTISACNQSLVRAQTEDDLLKEVCRYIVEIGGYLLAWIVYPGEEKEHYYQPVSYYGDERIYREHSEIALTPEHADQCLSIAALKRGKTIVCNNLHEANEYNLDKKLLDFGVNAILGLPLPVPVPGNGKVYGVLTIFSKNIDAFDFDEIKLMDELAANVSYGITSLRTSKERDEYLSRYGTVMQKTVAAIARTLEMRDLYTAGHQTRVARLAMSIAGHMGLSADQVEGIQLAGIVHDIGKIHIPAEILSKPGRLTDLEYEFIKTHPRAGYDILKDIEFPWPIAQMVLQHHEHLNGTGYPQRLKGDEILIEANILSVADIVEAMSSHRPYRPSLGVETALAEITAMRGIHFNPDVVDACLSLFQEHNYKITD